MHEWRDDAPIVGVMTGAIVGGMLPDDKEFVPICSLVGSCAGIIVGLAWPVILPPVLIGSITFAGKQLYHNVEPRVKKILNGVKERR